MRDILSDLEKWRGEDRQIAIATVVETWGSSPRVAGANMAMTPDGNITGSVSGGCVEGAVYDAGVEVLNSDQSQLLHYGVTDETAWEVGLACGGTIEIFVNPLNNEMFEIVKREIKASKPISIITLIRGPDDVLGNQVLIQNDQILFGSLTPELDNKLLSEFKRGVVSGKSKRFPLETSEDEMVEVFIDNISAPPKLVMVGGVHIAIELASLAKVMGYQTIVIDPRKAFGNPERFPNVDKLIQEWPQDALPQIELDSSTAVAMLTHDPKIDDPALEIVFNSEVFYVGALGSSTTQSKRQKRMKALGITEDQLKKLHGPIGLKIGGNTPEEIALSVMAEINTVRNGIKF